MFGVILVATLAATGELSFRADPTAAPTAAFTPRPTPIWSPTPIWGSHQGAGYEVNLSADVDDGFISCPSDAIVARDWFQGRVEFDFVVPEASVWSVGIVYHDHLEYNHDSAAFIARRGSGRVGVDHWTRTEWEDINNPPFKEVSVAEYGIFPGSVVRFGLLTSHDGSRVFVNGEQQMVIGSHELRPVSSVMGICAGFYSGEPRDYAIEVEKYRSGYTKSEAESTAIANPSPTPTR